MFSLVRAPRPVSRPRPRTRALFSALASIATAGLLAIGVTSPAFATVTPPSFNLTLKSSLSDTSDPGSSVSGAYVELYHFSNDDDEWDYVTEDETNSSGALPTKFTGLTAGDQYAVQIYTGFSSAADDWGGWIVGTGSTAHVASDFNESGDPDLDTWFTAGGATDPTVHLGTGISLSGNILDPNGDPTTAANEIDVYRETADPNDGTIWEEYTQDEVNTGTDTSYTVAGLAPGNYIVGGDETAQPSWAEQTFNTGSATLADATPLDLGADSVDLTQDVQFINGGIIQGNATISPAIIGDIYSEIQVNAYPLDENGQPEGDGGNPTSTDVDLDTGAYSLSVAPGSYDLEFQPINSASGTGDRSYDAQWYDNAPDSQSSTPITVTGVGETETANDQTIGRGLTISGTVTATGTGNLEGINVDAVGVNDDSDITATTDASGFYTMTVPPDEYNLQFSDPTGFYPDRYYDGGNDGTQDFDLATEFAQASGSVTENFNYDAYSTLTVHVANKAGTSLSSVQVIAQPMTDGSESPNAYSITATPVTGHAGTYLLSGLQQNESYALLFAPYGSSLTGTYLQYYGGSQNEASSTFYTPLDPTNSLDVTLQSAASVSGVVTNSAHHAIGGLEVDLYNFDGSSWNLVDYRMTSSSGAYSFSNVATGSYTVDYVTDAGSPYVSTFAGGASDAAHATAVYVAPGKPGVLSASLATGGTISGVVAGVAGTPKLADIGVTPILLTGTPGDFTAATVSQTNFTTSVAGGKFTLAGLATGYYALSFDDESDADIYGDSYVSPVGDPSSTTAYYHVTAGKATVVPGLIDLPLLTTVDDAEIDGSLDTSAVSPLDEPAGLVEIDDTDGNFITDTQIDAAGNFSVDLAPGDYTYEADIFDAQNQQAVYSIDAGSISVAAGDNPLVLTVTNEVPLQFLSDPSIVDTTNQTVGTTYTLDPGTWNHEGVDVSYQWLRNGSPIYGATGTTYTATGADLGALLQARVTLTDDPLGEELVDETATASESIQESTALTEPPIPGPSTSADAAGTILPGQTVHAYPGDWDGVQGVTFTYSWIDQDTFQTIATGPTFTPTPAEADRTIRLSVTASKSGYETSLPVADSSSILILSLAAPTVKVAPKVTAKVEGTKVLYTATAGTWSVAGGTPTFEWLDNDGYVGSGNTYLFDTVATPHDSLQVKVTDTITGHLPGNDQLVVRKDTTQLQSTATPPGVLDSATGADVPYNNAPVTVGSVLTADNSNLAFGDDETVPTAFTYVWQHFNGTAWVNIPGATHQTYTVTPGDVGDDLWVYISGSNATHAGGAAWGGDFAGAGAVNTALVDTPATLTPASTNTDDPLTKITENVSPWGTTTSVANAYRWFYCPATDDCTEYPTNFTQIAGATTNAYTPSAAQAQGTLVMTLTGTKAGYSPGNVISEPVTINAADIQAVSAPSIIAGLSGGNAVYGARLTARAGTFDVPGVTVSYLWQVSTDDSIWTTANGVHTGLTYTPTLTDLTGGNHYIRLQETASKSGYASANSCTTSTSCTAALGVALIGAVEVPKVAPSVILLNPSTWLIGGGTWATQSGYQLLNNSTSTPQLSYQWYVNNVPVDDTLATADPTSVLSTDSVEATVSFPGDEAYQPTIRTVIARKGAPPSWSSPTISGTASFGNTLTAPTDPADAFSYPGSGASTAVLTYQWYEGTTAISHATGSSYTPSSAYIGKSISVRITSTSPYYATGVNTTTGVLLTSGPANHGSPTMTTSGTVHPGATMGVTLGTYAAGVTHTYQWQVSTDESTWVNISAATKTSYVIPTTYLGDFLRLAVTTTKTGYLPAVDYTPDQAIVAAIVLAPITAPSMTGSGAVGTTLTVSPGAWDVPATAFTYQWYRDAVAIPGVTGATYTPTGDEVGSEITVTVTAHAAGYYAASATANSIAVTVGAAPTMVTIPKITGSTADGSTLTVTPGVWSLDGLTVSYQWSYYDPSSNASTTLGTATNSTYSIDPIDVPGGDELFCTVTVSRAGYTSKSVSTALTAPTFT